MRISHPQYMPVCNNVRGMPIRANSKKVRVSPCFSAFWIIITVLAAPRRVRFPAIGTSCCKCHHPGCGTSSLQDHGLEQCNERYIGYELADDHACSKNRRNRREARTGNKGLEKSGLPDAFHKHEHGSEKNEGAPVNIPDQVTPL